MRKEKQVLDRIKGLIETGRPLTPPVKKDFALSYEEKHLAAGWIVSAINCVELLAPKPANPYRMGCSAAKVKFDTSGTGLVDESSEISKAVSQVCSILESILLDVEAGLITQLESRIRGEAFDDFLDQADHMLKAGRIEAGVIAGVVFEDTVRRIGRDNSAVHDKVDEIISDLARKDVISATKAKSARVAAHVRTKATHAEWDAFDLSDVKAAIELTRALIDAHLS